MSANKVYLGDSVYAEFDTRTPGDVLLTTENGLGASNTIYFEPYVLGSLLQMLPPEVLKQYISKSLAS